MRMEKCDRCEMLIEEPSFMQKMLNNVSSYVADTVATLSGKPKLYVYTQKKTPACLCEHCQKSFEEWIKKGKSLMIEENKAEQI